MRPSVAPRPCTRGHIYSQPDKLRISPPIAHYMFGMYQSSLSWACLVCIGLLNLPALCEQSGRKPRPVGRAATNQRKQSAASSVAVTVDGPSLGPKFSGHDINAEVTAVRRSPASLPKSEFESTEQHQARVAAYKGPKKLAFRLFNEVDRETNVEASYDADAEVLTVDVKPMSYWFDGHDADGFLLKRDVLGRQQYVGSNAFGVKKLITREDYAEYGVLLPADDLIFIKDPFENSSHPRARFLIRMKPIDAAIVKTTLSVVLVCAVAEPKIFQDMNSDEPTISHPYETNAFRQFIPVTTRELILFNAVTGQIGRASCRERVCLYV